MPRDLITFEVVEWILRSWRFRVLYVSKGGFCCVSISLLLTFMDFWDIMDGSKEIPFSNANPKVLKEY